MLEIPPEDLHIIVVAIVVGLLEIDKDYDKDCQSHAILFILSNSASGLCGFPSSMILCALTCQDLLKSSRHLVDDVGMILCDIPDLPNILSEVIKLRFR